MKTLLACLFSTMLLIGNAHGLTFEGSGVPYETLETENFIVRYEPGDRQAAIDVSKALENSYEKITRDLGLKPKGKTVIELYTTPRLYKQYKKPAEWAIGGKVYPERNMIALASPSTWGDANIHSYEDLWHVLPHEYTHLLLRRYGLPIWLDEGIAVYEAGQWNPGYKRILKEAIEKDELLSLRELEGFNAFIAHGSLSYAESYSAVNYILDDYGDEALRELIKKMANGWSFEKSLKAATGKDMAEFEEDWRKYLTETLESERQMHAFKTMNEADAKAGKVSLYYKAGTPQRETISMVALVPYAGREELSSPWLFGASFAALLSVALLLRTLKTSRKSSAKSGR